MKRHKSMTASSNANITFWSSSGHTRINFLSYTPPQDITNKNGLDAGVIQKGAILGALSLYLHFITLFIMLLSSQGSSRE